MTWAYNEIDVYISLVDNILGEVSVDTENWAPLSDYGIIRGRPTLTPSTVEADAIQIPGRDGNTYTVDSRRGNAKVEFEILIADTWTHANSEFGDVRERTNLVFTYMNNAKRIAWKCPGREADSYFLIYKCGITITDAYEQAQLLKISLEVHPFEWMFEGNKPELIEQGSLTVDNPFPLSRCMPVYTFSGAGSLMINGQSLYAVTASAISGNPTVVLDTWKEIVYYESGGEIKNANKYLTGDYTNLWIYENESVTINSSFVSNVYVYTRKGIVR